jgi:arylsulfatase A-like enzyme
MLFTVSSLRTLATLLLVIFILTVFIACPTPPEKPQHYNFVVIMADDLGASELGCYGNPSHQTPSLDRIATEGMRFKTAWSTPLCTPTRAMIMTGQYAHHSGYFGQHGMRPKRESPFFDFGDKFTIADLLKTRGYATALAGKWQLMGQVPTLIFDCGFDEYRIWAYKRNLPPGIEHTGAWQLHGNTERYWHPSVMQNGEYIPTNPDDYGPDLFNEFIIDFIQRKKDEPFLIYYPMVLSHDPFYATPDTTRSVEDRHQSRRTNFKANVEYLDKLIGQIVETVDDLGLRENTIFFFTADNGTEGKGKGTVTEHGVRVPMIVRCPGTVKSGIVSDELVSLADIFATLGEFASASSPDGYPIDGRSFAPTLLNPDITHREWLYSYLNDKRLLRDKRWLLEGDGRFFDCGNNRNGDGYLDVTDSVDPDVIAARKRFEEILKTLPGPDSFADELLPPRAVNAKTERD